MPSATPAAWRSPETCCSGCQWIWAPAPNYVPVTGGAHAMAGARTADADARRLRADGDARRLRADADRLLLRTARRGGWWLALLGAAGLTGALAQVLLPAAVGRAVD